MENTQIDLAREAENLLCRRDRKRWIEKHFFIKDKGGQLRPFKDPQNPGSGLKPPQLKLLALLEWCRKNGLPARVIVLKARKTGISSVTEADMTCEVLSKGIDAIVIAHDDKTARYIYGMTERFLRNYDLPLPEFRRASKKELQFKDQEGLILVETANNVQAGTGTTPQYIHGSEVAKWQKGSETAVALFQSIGSLPDTTVVLESTAYGYDSLFEPMWRNAEKYCSIRWTVNDSGEWIPEVNIINRDLWNGYLPLFIAWFDDLEILNEPSARFLSVDEKKQFEGTLDSYEKSLLKRFPSLTLEHLRWRRYTMAEKCQGDLKKFQQEYPSTPQEAFITTGRPRFDHGILGLMPIEEGVRGFLVRDDEWFSTKIKFRRDPSGLLKVFREPVISHRYVIGVDIAEGKIREGNLDPDGTVAIVLDLDDMGAQVATLAGQISEEMLVEPLILLGYWYNTALIVPERVGYGQHVAIELVKTYPNEKIYKRSSLRRGKIGITGDVGFRTTSTSKYELISGLAQALVDEAVTIRDSDTLREFKSFMWTEGGRVEAARGSHDDHVMAFALAVRGMKEYPENYSRVLGFNIKDSSVLKLYNQKQPAKGPEPLIDGY